MGKLRVASRQNGPEVTTYLQEFQTDGKQQRKVANGEGEFGKAQSCMRNIKGQSFDSQTAVNNAIKDCNN